MTAERLSHWSVRTGGWRTEQARWRLWLGADAKHELASAELTVEADPAPAPSWPLEAWLADRHHELSCDSVDGLRGWSVRPAEVVGSLGWSEVPSVRRASLRARRLAPARAVITVSSDAGEATVTLDDRDGWLDLPVGPVAGEVEVRLRGPVLVDRLTASEQQ